MTESLSCHIYKITDRNIFKEPIYLKIDSSISPNVVLALN